RRALFLDPMHHRDRIGSLSLSTTYSDGRRRATGPITKTLMETTASAMASIIYAMNIRIVRTITSISLSPTRQVCPGCFMTIGLEKVLEVGICTHICLFFI